jgi:hypothetical protein
VRWRRLGLIFAPDGSEPWLRSHAANPVAVPLDGAVCRVYFASRDATNRSHVAAIDVDLEKRGVVRGPWLVLAPGPLGHFDDHGVYASSVVDLGEGRWRMYVTGWNPGMTPPLFYTAAGVAESDDGGLTFERPRSPILQRSDVDPWMVSQPSVRLDDGAWRMWYISGLGWDEVDGELLSSYHLKYAESDDGLSWRRDGRVAIALADGERNIARGCVLRSDRGYEMWYSRSAGKGYTLGYARSPDGVEWTRLDAEAGLEPAPGEWDDAIAYPWVVEHESTRYLLYNGRGFGRDGIGLAVEEPA